MTSSNTIPALLRRRTAGNWFMRCAGCDRKTPAGCVSAKEAEEKAVKIYGYKKIAGKFYCRKCAPARLA